MSVVGIVVVVVLLAAVAVAVVVVASEIMLVGFGLVSRGWVLNLASPRWWHQSMIQS